MPVLVSRPSAIRYELCERLGAGGFAEAWRARRIGSLLHDEVCLKIPRRPLDASLRRNLLEEARLMARIRHPNVVTLFGAEEDDSRHVFLVLELVRGVDLSVLVERVRAGHRYSEGVVAYVGACLCRALAAAQIAVPPGVVHRDVSPKNVLVSRDGQVKLTDFGVARAFDRQSWTLKGRVKGKLAYLSPEQLVGGPLGVQSDLFAVGILLHELATGLHPFRRASRTATLRAIADGSGHLALSGDTPLGAVVLGLLSTNPSGRPPSARVAAEQLEELADVRSATRVLAHAAQERGPGLARCGRARLSSGVRARDDASTLEARTLGLAR